MGTLMMLKMTEQYGKDNSIEGYIMSLSETDEARMIFETVEDLYHYKYERADSVIETMIANYSAN